VVERSVQTPPSLYHEDETAWLETMARLLAESRFDELDYAHLSEFLSDVARRDKREVLSRLAVLMAHLLKWDRQPDQRSNSWRATIVVRRQELQDLFESRTLFHYAQEVLAKAYARAVAQASVETGVPEGSFPADCPFPLDAILGEGEPRSRDGS
jgi:hypothetical protein